MSSPSWSSSTFNYWANDDFKWWISRSGKIDKFLVPRNPYSEAEGLWLIVEEREKPIWCSFLLGWLKTKGCQARQKQAGDEKWWWIQNPEKSLISRAPAIDEGKKGNLMLIRCYLGGWKSSAVKSASTIWYLAWDWWNVGWRYRFGLHGCTWQRTSITARQEMTEGILMEDIERNSCRRSKCPCCFSYLW